ncbi:hypothetical protein CWE12_04030 [Aliidiomarina sedimenti]|uniref:UPF0250 protein CWE14_00600 n=3 Tax=Idiomarinaceae TaxID=267893 RepID=A0A432WLA2_9GAMM|nr:hypothetical protein CWE12_04030 [Aliidiomarina sedimenti]RUO34544.1 hypothetical protein CWE14_00600 [Aliidiomarina soli]
MQTKFDQLLDFPCDFTFKVMGLATDSLEEQIVAVVQQHAPGDYQPKQRPSSKGTYASVSINVVVHSKDHVELLYRELSAIDDVRYVL